MHILRVFEQTGVVDERRHDGSEEQPERRGRESAEREAFQHLVYGDQKPAEAKADKQPKDRAEGVSNKLRPNLADSVTRRRAEAQEEDSDRPKRFHRRDLSLGDLRASLEVFRFSSLGCFGKST